MKLQNEFEERCRRNDSYSLRAFAKSLQMPVTSVQGILNGSRPMTSRAAARVSLALGWYLDFIETPAVENYEQLTLDSFSLISDWYNYAILELLKTKGFKPDIAWIARRLGISPSETRIAVERLVRLGLLETKGQRWREPEGKGHLTNITGVLSSEASRKYQRQSLERSLKSLSEVDVRDRDHTSMVMAIDPKDIPDAREMIKEFRRRFCKKLETTKNSKEVYQIQISFFPLTRSEEQS